MWRLLMQVVVGGLCSVANLMVGAVEVNAVEVDSRVGWQYTAKGKPVVICKRPDGRWQAVRADGRKAEYREVDRDAKQITLQNTSSQLFVRLEADYGYWRRPDDKDWTRWLRARWLAEEEFSNHVRVVLGRVVPTTGGDAASKDAATRQKRRAGGTNQLTELPAGATLQMGSRSLWHETWLTDVAFSHDDRHVATADSNGTVRVWNVSTGNLAWQLPAKAGRKLAYSPDGNTIATSGYYQKSITLWDLRTRERIATLSQNARALAYSPDGKLLVAAGRDSIVRIWDARTFKLVRQLEGHQGGLYAVAISSDGRMIASGGGGDGTSPAANEIRLWEVSSGRQSAFEGESVWKTTRLR